jgi:hypothetical protein
LLEPLKSHVLDRIATGDRIAAGRLVRELSNLVWIGTRGLSTLCGLSVYLPCVDWNLPCVDWDDKSVDWDDQSVNWSIGMIDNESALGW